MADDGINFRYPSYVQDIMGPMCFDFGFGPFRWVCTSGSQEDLDFTDQLAAEVLEEIEHAPRRKIRVSAADNIQLDKGSEAKQISGGFSTRGILYADVSWTDEKSQEAFNEAIPRQ